MAENPEYDLLLRGGRVICPAPPSTASAMLPSAAAASVAPAFCLRAGRQRIDADAPILPRAVAA